MREAPPPIDPTAPLQFVINAAAGSQAAEAKREVIETALQAAGRPGHLHFCRPSELAGQARRAAEQAHDSRTAVVAVGGDGTLNTVAQAALASHCPMGVVPQGTFNYFARSHGLPNDPAEAMTALLQARPQPVRVGAINERVFLVNASLGLYPELLEDREAYKARFGRSRWVALWAAAMTLLRAQRQLRLHIEAEGQHREVRTLTLFVGNNRLQLAQLGMPPADGPSTARITAVMLKPIGSGAMLRLMLHGALGTLGEADNVEHFEFRQLRVRPSLVSRRRGIKVAFDGEVARMQGPLNFRVLDQPLFLLKPEATPAQAEAGAAPPGDAP